VTSGLTGSMLASTVVCQIVRTLDLAGTMSMWHFVDLLADKVRGENDTFSALCSWGGPLPLGSTTMPAERAGARDGQVAGWAAR
jgi:hypothetical protein